MPPQITVQNLPDWVLRQNLPKWIREKNPNADPKHLTGLYRNYLYGTPTAPNAPKLTKLYGDFLATHKNARGNKGLMTFDPYKAPGTPAGGVSPANPTPAAPPATPGAPPVSPSTPVTNTPATPPAGPVGSPQQTSPGLRDIYDVYLSTVPVMNKERDDQISSAMATAGFSGNRYGTAAMNTAGKIGADTALKQNQLLTSLLHQQNEDDSNRSLQATGQAMQMAGLENQIQQGKLDQLFNFGKWEQGRMDDYGKLAYQDFEANKYGMLPLLMNFAASQSGGSGPTPYVTQTGGSTGAADWMTLLAGLFK